jgi:DNA topoisomerase-2
VARAVTEAAAKKKIVVKPSAVKNHAFVFVNVTAVNPTFDTQSKEFLTSKTKIALPDAFLKKAAALLLPDVIAEATVRASLADERNLKKTDGSKKSRVTGIAKLTDANWAGTRRSGECTLILTEGDSAKSLAVAGLTVVGRDKYGVFPLRGKLLNCRDAAVAAVANNVEITALKQILGLQTGKTYADASGLRYGHVMVMADSDHDGAHIAGLVVNFFHACFPSLVEIRGFFQKFITPIVRARRGREIVSFYSLPELDEWTRATPAHREWTLKYYKVSKTSFHTLRIYHVCIPLRILTFLHSNINVFCRDWVLPRPKRRGSISPISASTSRRSNGRRAREKRSTKPSTNPARRTGANGCRRTGAEITWTTPSRWSPSPISSTKN